jgi:hypothetical protein
MTTIKTTVGTFEPERVDFGAWPEPVKFALCAALAASTEKVPIVPGEADVLFVCNGVQLSFEHVILRFRSELEERIQKAGRAMVDEQAARATNDIMDRLALLSGAIDRELDELFPLAKRDEDGY